MNIYKVELKKHCDYDQYDAFIVVAPSEVAAAAYHPRGVEYRLKEDGWHRVTRSHEGVATIDNYADRTWPMLSLRDVTITRLGDAAPGLEAGVLLSSFNAG